MHEIAASYEGKYQEVLPVLLPYGAKRSRCFYGKFHFPLSEETAQEEGAVGLAEGKERLRFWSTSPA
jgi:hypothetical protein